EEGVGNCPKCTKKVDLLTVLVEAVTDNFMWIDAYQVLGATTTVFSFKLRNNDNKDLIFKEYGIPEGSRVLSINYTPSGEGLGCFPIELHGNTPYRGLPRDHVLIFGRSYPTSDTEETDVNCAI